MLKKIMGALVIMGVSFLMLTGALAADNTTEPAPPTMAPDIQNPDRRYGTISNERMTLWVSTGPKIGNVRYRIGGDWNNYTEGTSGKYHFPLSELKWPINAIMGEIGGEVHLGKRWALRGSFTRNMTNNIGGKMEDSDWDYDPDLYGDRPDIYSESVTDFQGYVADASVRYWFLDRQFGGKTSFAMGIGLGFMYQDYHWVASNLDQWYPREPSWGHDYAGGPVVTYKSWLKMPYAELLFKSKLRRFDISGAIGGSPYLWVKDEDTHLLRNRIMTTDAKGFALKGSLQGSYAFTQNWFAGLRLNLLYYHAWGTQDSYVYADTFEGGQWYYAGYHWDIEHKIDSFQFDAMLTAGFRF
jgi:hypothetical protein